VAERIGKDQEALREEQLASMVVDGKGVESCKGEAVLSGWKDISQSLGGHGKEDYMLRPGVLNERFSFKLHKENTDCRDTLHNAVTNPDHN